MKFAALTLEEIVFYSLRIKFNNLDGNYLQALIKFIEYNNNNIYERIINIHEKNSLIILHCLNLYIINNLQSENPDIRLLNAILKYKNSKFFNEYSDYYKQILSHKNIIFLLSKKSTFNENSYYRRFKF